MADVGERPTGGRPRRYTVAGRSTATCHRGRCSTGGGWPRRDDRHARSLRAGAPGTEKLCKVRPVHRTAPVEVRGGAARRGTPRSEQDRKV